MQLCSKIKTMKTRSFKTKGPLVEQKTVTYVNLLLTRNWRLPVFTEIEPEIERNKIK